MIAAALAATASLRQAVPCDGFAAASHTCTFAPARASGSTRSLASAVKAGACRKMGMYQTVLPDSLAFSPESAGPGAVKLVTRPEYLFSCAWVYCVPVVPDDVPDAVADEGDDDELPQAVAAIAVRLMAAQAAKARPRLRRWIVRDIEGNSFVYTWLSAERPPAGEGRDDYRGDKRGPVEHIAGPAGVAQQLQPDDAGDEEIDRHHRADRVEPARLDNGGAEESRRQGGQEIGRRAVGIEAADGRREQDAARPAEQAAHDLGADPDACHAHPRQPGDLAVGADERHVPAQRGEAQDIRDQQGQGDAIEEGDREAKHHNGVRDAAEGVAEPGDRLGVREPRRDPEDQRAHAERRDDRVDPQA